MAFRKRFNRSFKKRSFKRGFKRSFKRRGGAGRRRRVSPLRIGVRM